MASALRRNAEYSPAETRTPMVAVRKASGEPRGRPPRRLGRGSAGEVSSSITSASQAARRHQRNEVTKPLGKRSDARAQTERSEGAPSASEASVLSKAKTWLAPNRAGRRASLS